MDDLKALCFDSMTKFFESVRGYKANKINNPSVLQFYFGKGKENDVEILSVGSDCILIEYKASNSHELLPYSSIRRICIEPKRMDVEVYCVERNSP